MCNGQVNAKGVMLGIGPIYQSIKNICSLMVQAELEYTLTATSSLTQTEMILAYNYTILARIKTYKN